mgnify:CR=1 FL=1
MLHFSSLNSFAIASPDPTPKYGLRKLTVRNIERLAGKKLTLLQKIQIFIIKKKLQNPNALQQITEGQKRWARASILLGIASIILLVLSSLVALGFLSILALPASILAISFGAKSLEGNSNTEGFIGVVTGGLTLALIVIAVIELAILLGNI